MKIIRFKLKLNKGFSFFLAINTLRSVMIRKKLIYLSSLLPLKEMHYYFKKDPQLSTINSSDANAYFTNLQYNVITIFDDNFPQHLKEITASPLVLYYIGNLSLLSKKSIAIVGSRIPTAYGIRATSDLISNHSYSVVISGFSKGIAQVAHEITLNLKKQTIAILGSGFDHIYPRNNPLLLKAIIDHGLLITEYPPHFFPLKNHFLQRNRLIALLCDKLYILEARKLSGTISTAQFALEYNKEIYVLPGNIYERNAEGCNQLIADGANLITLQEILGKG